jgi:hypothetical protein
VAAPRTAVAAGGVEGGGRPGAAAEPSSTRGMRADNAPWLWRLQAVTDASCGGRPAFPWPLRAAKDAVQVRHCAGHAGDRAALCGGDAGRATGSVDARPAHGRWLPGAISGQRRPLRMRGLRPVAARRVPPAGHGDARR